MTEDARRVTGVQVQYWGEATFKDEVPAVQGKVTFRLSGRSGSDEGPEITVMVGIPRQGDNPGIKDIKVELLDRAIDMVQALAALPREQSEALAKTLD